MRSEISDRDEEPMMGRDEAAMPVRSHAEGTIAGSGMYSHAEGISSNDYYSMREVIIKPLSSGFLVTIGCQTAAVETTETLLKNLNAYFSNPHEFEKEWNKNKNRSKV